MWCNLKYKNLIKKEIISKYKIIKYTISQLLVRLDLSAKWFLNVYTWNIKFDSENE